MNFLFRRVRLRPDPFCCLFSRVPAKLRFAALATKLWGQAHSQVQPWYEGSALKSSVILSGARRTVCLSGTVRSERSRRTRLIFSDDCAAYATCSARGRHAAARNRMFSPSFASLMKPQGPSTPARRSVSSKSNAPLASAQDDVFFKEARSQAWRRVIPTTRGMRP
jgi:hypothetical protein